MLNILQDSTTWFNSTSCDYDSQIAGFKENLQEIYKIFNFKIIQFETSMKDEENIQQELFNFLTNFKFITFQIHEIFQESKKKYKTIICIEGKCLIIELFDDNPIHSILNKLKSSKIVVNCEKKQLSEQINEEIESLYEYFFHNIKKNEDFTEFVKLTYRPIFTYIVRRNFYPSNYFTNQSFFNFENALINKKIKNEFDKFIKFDENDFIKLRMINSAQSKIIYLAFHIKTQCLVVMNEIDNSSEKYINRQINFFKNYSHKNTLKCFGYCTTEHYFVFINEFMSNGSIEEYFKNHSDEINFFYSFLTMNRIFQSLKHIHSNSLIHRDIKPSNILINHDFLPFLSDFETTCSSEFSSNFCYSLYLAPEQKENSADNPIQLTYSTDIYSFGRLIYFLFEKENMIKEENEYKNTPKEIQGLIKKCISYLPKDRPSIGEIDKVIIDQIYLYSYFDPDYLKNHYLKLRKEHIDNFLNDCLELISQENDREINFRNIFQLLVKEKDISCFLQQLGAMYRDGHFGKSDYFRARKLFEISSELNNSESLISLGNMYRDGLGGVEKDYKKAIEYYKKSSEMNNSMAYILIGNLYCHGQGVEQSYLTAKDYYKKSADLNNSEGYVGLALIYLKGMGVQQDVQKAIEYFKKSADMNNTYASIYLGNIYLRGIVTENNFNETIKYYKKAADLGNSEGLVGLGALYLKGLGVDKDYLIAKKYFEEAACLNNCNAYLRLGGIYLHGFGVKRNYLEAIRNFKISSNKGNSNALVRLGYCYLQGFGVEQNFEETKKYFELAEKRNNLDAISGLGYLYLLGLGVKQDYKKAKEYFEKSLEKNNPMANIYIGNLYLYGHGVKENWSIANSYYEKSLQVNNTNGYFYLGRIYYYGIHTVIDYEKALIYFNDCNKSFNSDAIIYIGNCYLNGFGTKKDIKKAIEFYESAAEADNSNALNQLGKIYLKGNEIIKQNYQKSREYFEKASDVYNPSALYNLAKMYYKGLGVKKDYKKALQYFEQSESHLNKKASLYLGRIFENGEGVKIDLESAIKHYKNCANHNEETFIRFNANGWMQNTHYNKYYYQANNILGVIYLEKNQIEEAQKYLHIAGYGEFPFGKNNFGLFNEIYLRNLQKAKQMFESASKYSFSLSEFNMGRLIENDKKMIDELSIIHYNKAILYENEPLIFQNHLYCDEQLDISKSFIVCLTNLKLCLHYLSQDNLELSQTCFVNAIFKPILKYLFNDNCQSYSFQIDINVNDDKSISTNFADFIINFPIFKIENNKIATRTWTKIEDEFSKTIFIQFKEPKNHQNKINKDKIQTKNELLKIYKVLDNIFDYYNNNKKYEKIMNNQENGDEISVFIFKNDKNDMARKVKYSNRLFEFISNHIKDMENDIYEITKKINQILFKSQYTILFGRIGFKKEMKNINNDFYEGFGLNQ